MRAGRFVGTHQPLTLEEVERPQVRQPTDVVVRIAGAGVCRTDLHILDGVAPLQPPPKPPFTLGHENAGWIDEVGSGVDTCAKGDAVILHPAITCGLCSACRSGADMYCPKIRFPGVDGSDGGYADYLLTSVRTVVPLSSGVEPSALAPFADAGLTAYHAVKRMTPLLHPGSAVVVLGVGGLGHLAIQLLKTMTPARVVALDLNPERLEFARELGADHGLLAGDPSTVTELQRITGGLGAEVVMDFVAEGSAPELALRLVRRGGTYAIVGYGGILSIPTVNVIASELTIQGNFVGTYRDLVELMELNREGRVKISARTYALEDAPQAIEDLRHGRVLGRAVLTP
jgi:D-arabinose 1-dehydrogenase-like Zn-dependent alcohol dehydrogenase